MLVKTDFEQVFNPLNKATEDLFSSTMVAKLVRAEENFKNSK